jgi:hypothetical protein
MGWVAGNAKPSARVYIAQRHRHSRSGKEPVAELLPIVRLVAHVPEAMLLTLFEKVTVWPSGTVQDELSPLGQDMNALGGLTIIPGAPREARI